MNGDFNNAVGCEALLSDTDGEFNNALGDAALYSTIPPSAISHSPAIPMVMVTRAWVLMRW
jgi:hypothetical protein